MKPLTRPQFVVKLRSTADADGFRNGHYVVAAPVAPGPQPCLIVVTRPGAVYDITDTLAVLPGDVPTTSEFPNPELSGNLGVAAQEYSDLIDATRDDPYVQEITTRSWNEPPFAVMSSGGGQLWRPHELARGRVMSGGKWTDHRLILSRWEDWDFRHLTRDKRLIEYLQAKGEPIPHDAAERDKAWERFRAKCRYLGLSLLPPIE